MECVGSLLCSEELSAGPYLNSDEYSLHFHIIFKIRFNTVLSFVPSVPYGLFPPSFPTKILYSYLNSSICVTATPITTTVNHLFFSFILFLPSFITDLTTVLLSDGIHSTTFQLQLLFALTSWILPTFLMKDLSKFFFFSEWISQILFHYTVFWTAVQQSFHTMSLLIMNLTYLCSIVLSSSSHTSVTPHHLLQNLVLFLKLYCSIFCCL